MKYDSVFSMKYESAGYTIIFTLVTLIDSMRILSVYYRILALITYSVMH